MAAAGGEVAGGDTGDFAVGERVFVPHVDRHYEAKILKAELKRNVDYPEGGWYYFLHYSGWNKKYDEWVESGGLVKASDLGVAAHAGPPPGPAVGGGGGVVGGGGGGKGAAGPRKMPKERFAAAMGGGVGGKKAARLASDLGMGGAAGGGAGGSGGGAGVGDVGGGTVGGSAPRGLQLELDISPVLKKALLEDYDAVVTDGKLAPLPRSPCVADVLRRYCEHAAEAAGSGAHVLAHSVEGEVAAGLRTYFDKALLAVLLYRSERPQSMALLADGRLPSSVYGAEHLLRLFVKLPELLAAAGAGSMNEEMLIQTATAVQDLMNWVAENLDSLLAPKDTYLDHYEFMANLTGEIAEAVAAAGFVGTGAGLGPHGRIVPPGAAAGGREQPAAA